jgi:hypothetical protein
MHTLLVGLGRNLPKKVNVRTLFTIAGGGAMDGALDHID